MTTATEPVGLSDEAKQIVEEMCVTAVGRMLNEITESLSDQICSSVNNVRCLQDIAAAEIGSKIMKAAEEK